MDIDELNAIDSELSEIIRETNELHSQLIQAGEDSQSIVRRLIAQLSCEPKYVATGGYTKPPQDGDDVIDGFFGGGGPVVGSEGSAYKPGVSPVLTCTESGGSKLTLDRNISVGNKPKEEL